jgi:hypothetical protein
MLQDQLSDSVGDIAIHRREHVLVHVRCDSRLAMTEPFGPDLHGHSSSDSECRPCVPQVLQSDGRHEFAVAFQRPRELARKPFGVVRPSVWMAKQIGAVRGSRTEREHFLGLPRPMRSQPSDRLRVKIELTTRTGFRPFRDDDLVVDQTHGATDRCPTPFKVNVAALQNECKELRDRLDEVVDEAYVPDGEHSYFADLAARNVLGNMHAAARLSQHVEEIRAETTREGFEQRTAMNGVDGHGGEFVPPVWLMEQFVPIARAGRLMADSCRAMPLPASTDQINLPCVTTGAATATQSDNTSVQSAGVLSVTVS